jgi:hypothetical protein
MNSRALLTGSLVAFGLLAAPAAAGPRDDVLDAMNKCVAITDNTARLACYDALQPQLQAALSAPPPVAAVAPPQQTAQDQGTSLFGLHLWGGETPQTKPSEFGNDHLPAEKRAEAAPAAAAPVPQIQEIDSITMKLTDYATTASGRFIVFLDNGQVWQQVEGDTAKARFMKPASANTVTITRAFMGSYALRLNDLNATFKVKRMK